MAVRSNDSAASPRPTRLVALYAAGGLAAGCLILPLVPFVRAAGLARDASVAASAFVLLPLAIIGLGRCRARLLLHLLGALLAGIGWGVGYAVSGFLMGFDRATVGFGLALMAPWVIPISLVAALIVGLLGRTGRGTVSPPPAP